MKKQYLGALTTIMHLGRFQVGEDGKVSGRKRSAPTKREKRLAARRAGYTATVNRVSDARGFTMPGSLNK